MATKSIVKRFNEQRYQEWGRLNPADKIRIQKVLKLVGTNKTVLDVGCFDGSISERVLKNGNEVYGLEISGPAVKKAWEKGIKAKEGDIEERWPYEDSFFDVVLAGEIIEHLFDTGEFLEEAKRVLRPDGFLVLTTPNLASLGRRLLLFLGKNPLMEAGCLEAVAGHLRYFVKDSLFELLRRRNFAIVSFKSSVVNFNASGSLYSRILADFFPTLGSSLIVKCRVKR